MADKQGRNEPGPSAGGYPKFFSSAKGVSLPVGAHVRPGEVRGYYIDFSLKAQNPSWPPPWIVERRENHVVAAQWGLGCFERHLHGDGEVWLAAGLGAAGHFLDEQATDGGWPHHRPMRHTYRLDTPWLSAMAQGEGASLLVRAYLLTGDDRFAEAALRALRPMGAWVEDGGVRARLGDGWFPEEYPTTPPSYVLNGGIFSLWGYYDVAVGLDDDDARRAFAEGVDSLARNIDRWDTGAWTQYDLVPRRVAHVSSSFYHQLHIDQLRAMQLIAPRPEFDTAATRWEAYQRSRAHRLRAFARKVVFRVLVPRNPVLAHRSPFARAVESPRM